MYTKNREQVIQSAQQYKDTMKIKEDKAKALESSLLFQNQQIAELKIVTASKDSEIKELKSQLEIVEVLEKSIIVKDKHIEEVEMNNKSKDSEIKVLNIKLSEMEEKLEVTEEILKQRELEEEEWDEMEDSSSDTEEEVQKSPEDESDLIILNEVKTIPQKISLHTYVLNVEKELETKKT